ncbi:AAA family ATPase [Actinomadura rupiterrae]|uniref:AAA family ATPase n=1 Tax=Actinomadura rupiterrae TaxID=559627 RepID=UPI0020A405E1|nr:SMC family ATPase [Actinomadura rupiterrae]MCP2336296.1 exonuclease SbcC [Actinomadura rupiterrae]
MRLHRLVVTAFGPFGDEQEIDFGALADAGLFLIQGQTGAGKTSVLDAVCFALYGQVPGVRNSARGLRSDHAAPDLAPSVQLETTIRGRRLRITRSPEWFRPKKRGEGLTKENAKVVLEEFEHGEWVALSTRVGEADDVIGRLLGMTAAQFCQVAMLPQGAFAGFLRAKAGERREVLERLFSAEVFSSVEQWLAERRRDAGRDADARRVHAESVAGRIAEVAGERGPHDASPVPAPRQGQPRGGEAQDALETVESLPAWARGLVAEHRDILDVQRDLHRDAVDAASAAREELDAARELAKHQQQHADALRKREQLAEYAEARASWAARLDAAARADRVIRVVQEVAAREGQEQRARAHAAAVRTRVATLVPPGAAEDVLTKAERDRRDEIAMLEGRRETAHRLRDITREREQLSTTQIRLNAELAQLADALEELPGRVEAHRTAVEQARVAAAELPGSRAATEELDRKLAAAERRDHLAVAIEQADDRHSEAVDTAQNARDVYQDLQQARLEGMAAVLAAELEPGEPCRVCGATEHPEPATPSGDIPDKDAVDRARAAFEAAEKRREDAKLRVRELRGEYDAKLEVAGEEPAAEFAASLQAARERQDELAAVAARAEHLEAELRRVQGEEQRLRTRHEEVSANVQTVRAQDEGLADQHVRLTAELDAARGDDPTLEARIDRLDREASALGAAAEALRTAEQASRELAAARDAASRAATEELFASPEAASAAWLDDEDQAPLRDRLRRYEQTEAVVENALKDPQLRAAADRPAPDLPAYEAAAARAEAAATAAASAVSRSELRLSRLDERCRELATAVAAWRPAAEAYAVAERMAGLVSGTSPANRDSISLTAYVLAARLERVVAAANERLGRMSAGRYVLRHTVDKAAGDRSKSGGGLGLRVVDAWTGADRDPATLSGGESFITSLSLALGLADVVTAEAGGTEVNTLFVDEGFGTLDDETLDEVMAVLDALRDGGRAVGVVSHVAELRTRIPAQLKVTKTRTGSTVHVTA